MPELAGVDLLGMQKNKKSSYPFYHFNNNPVSAIRVSTYKSHLSFVLSVVLVGNVPTESILIF